MATATMTETVHRDEQEIPPEECSECGTECMTQVYYVTLERPKVTRMWSFCTLTCLRKWMRPV